MKTTIRRALHAHMAPFYAVGTGSHCWVLALYCRATDRPYMHNAAGCAELVRSYYQLVGTAFSHRGGLSSTDLASLHGLSPRSAVFHSRLIRQHSKGASKKHGEWRLCPDRLCEWPLS